MEKFREKNSWQTTRIYIYIYIKQAKRQVPSNVSNKRGISITMSLPKIMHTHAKGWVGNEKELEFQNREEENKPDIKGIVEIKLNKVVKSHVVFPEG